VLIKTSYSIAVVTDQIIKDQTLKSSTKPLNWLIRPALFLAVAIHGLLLFTPLPTQKKPQAVRPTEVETQVTRLPAPSSPKPVLASPIATSPIPPIARPAPISPSIQSAPSAIAPPATPAPATPKPIATPTPNQTPPPANLQIPFANLPNLAGAQAGCFGSENCRQVSDGTPFRNAAQTLEQQMTAQGYQVSERDDLSDTGQKIYQLKAQDGATRYLNVLSSDVGSTIYLLSPEPITLRDLQQVDTVKANLATLIAQQGSAAIAPQIPYPALFLAGTNPRPEVGQLRVIAGVKPDQFTSTFTRTLQDNQFSLSPVGSYGGGKMYEVGKKAFTGYVNLVATADGTGTMMVLWNTVPR
jgi:hypothetical protein